MEIDISSIRSVVYARRRLTLISIFQDCISYTGTHLIAVDSMQSLVASPRSLTGTSSAN